MKGESSLAKTVAATAGIIDYSDKEHAVVKELDELSNDIHRAATATQSAKDVFAVWQSAKDGGV